MTLPPIKAPYDVANPPMGVRLQIGKIAASLCIPLPELAAAAQISRTAMFAILGENRWPARTPAASIRALLEDFMRERGASDDQVARLFWAQGHHEPGGPIAAPHGQQQDHYGRAIPRIPGRRSTRADAKQPLDEDDDMLLPKQALTPLAARHFKLFRNPFDGEVLSDEQMFNSDDVRYVREAAWQCAQHSGFVAIVGESGAGKTTIQADIESRLEREQRGTIVIKPSVLGMEENNNQGQMLKAADILSAIITALEPLGKVPQTLQARTVRAKKLLTASVEAGNTHLLVIEEAHGLPDPTLKHLKRLHELRQGRRTLLGILLLAQPELKVRLQAGLRSGLLREVAQRCEVVELLPLDNDLQGYLQCRAAAAGQDLAKLLDDAAVAQLRVKLTRKTQAGAVSICYPLAVNNMVTRCLNAAAELGVPIVTKDVVASV